VLPSYTQADDGLLEAERVPVVGVFTTKIQAIFDG